MVYADGGRSCARPTQIRPSRLRTNTHVDQVARVRPHEQLIVNVGLGRPELQAARISSFLPPQRNERTIFHRSNPPKGSTVLRGLTRCRFPSCPSFSCAASAASSASRLSSGGGSGGSSMCWGCHGERVMEREGGRRFWRSRGGVGSAGPIVARRAGGER